MTVPQNPTTDDHAEEVALRRERLLFLRLCRAAAVGDIDQCVELVRAEIDAGRSEELFAGAVDAFLAAARAVDAADINGVIGDLERQDVLALLAEVESLPTADGGDDA